MDKKEITFTHAELEQAAQTLDKLAEAFSDKTFPYSKSPYWAQVAEGLRRLELSPAIIVPKIN